MILVFAFFFWIGHYILIVEAKAQTVNNLNFLLR